MKILLICSKSFYGELAFIAEKLEKRGHKIYFPNSYEFPEREATVRGTPKHAIFKAEMYRRSQKIISETDGVLCVNMTKNGVENYIGGATFLELYDAFCAGKKIFLLNPVPKGILEDEIIGFSPKIINGNLDLID